MPTLPLHCKKLEDSQTIIYPTFLGILPLGGLSFVYGDFRVGSIMREDFHPPYRGIFIHLLFVEPLPHISPLCAPLPVFPLSPLYIPPPPHSYSLCVSYIYSRSPPYLIPPT